MRIRRADDETPEVAAEPTVTALSDLVKPERVLCNVEARSKKHALEILSELLASDGDLVAGEILDALIGRERLGSTAPGSGVAIPHCRLDGLSAHVGALLRLATPVGFDAPDQQPVDVIFGLLVPETTVGRSADLPAVSTLLSDAEFVSHLREANSSRHLYDYLMERDLQERPGDEPAEPGAEESPEAEV